LEGFGRLLVSTMEEGNGIGLASPQVGVLKRMFVMRFPDHEDLKPIVVCNPTLDLGGVVMLGREGCLSLPGIFEQVIRAEEVIMRYRDPGGKHDEVALHNLDARVAQHEFDHMNGIMFFNYKDKREKYGARMSKQVSKQTLRRWEKERRDL
jgi:peptide deformylase